MKKKKLCGPGTTPKIPTGNNLARPFGGRSTGGVCVGPAGSTSGGGANEAAAAAAAVVDATDCDECHPLLSSPSRFGAQNHATDTYNYSGETVPFFTSAQWKELERQAMIYKYMISSEPVPLHLLYPSTSRHTKSGAAVELGRCKRTDGKKWRCSRDVAPHQKYCERHLHRGRPRSRKPVEFDTSNIINGDDTIKKPRLEKTYQTLSSFDEKLDPNGIATTSLGRKMNGELGLIMENNAFSDKVSSNYIPNALFNQMDHHMLSSSNFPIHFLGACPMDNTYGNINNLNKYSSQLVQNEELSPWPNFSMELAGAPVLGQGIADGGSMDGVEFYDEGAQWSGPVCYSEPFGPGGPLAEALCLNPTSPHDSRGGLGTAFSSPSGVNDRRLFLQFDGGAG